MAFAACLDTILFSLILFILAIAANLLVHPFPQAGLFTIANAVRLERLLLTISAKIHNPLHQRPHACPVPQAGLLMAFAACLDTILFSLILFILAIAANLLVHPFPQAGLFTIANAAPLEPLLLTIAAEFHNRPLRLPASQTMCLT